MSNRQAGIAISFDEDNRIRILESEHFRKTENLAEESNNFVQKIGQFEKTSDMLVQILSSQAAKIEAQKLTAIGLRNQVESESENRQRQQQQLQADISQRRAELDRLIAQHESLVRVDQEQRAMLDKLQKGE